VELSGNIATFELGDLWQEADHPMELLLVRV
jgi:hypothetical protein